MILLEVTPLTTREQRALVYLVIMVLMHFGLRLLKGTKLEFLYTGWKMFWIVLFATLAINFAKTEIKKWWNKDWPGFGIAGAGHEPVGIKVDLESFNLEVIVKAK